MIKLKDILLEGVMDTWTNAITKEIVAAFKSKKNYDKPYTIQFDDEEADIDLSVEFLERPNLDYSHSIEGEVDPKGDDDHLSISISYNPSMFPRAMNDLVAEIFETVRHELEHVGQNNFYQLFVVHGDVHNSYEGYLTSNREVPAYVKGFITRAKKKKQSLEQVMDAWRQENKLNFDADPDADWNKIKNVWLNWAKANKDKLRKYD